MTTWFAPVGISCYPDRKDDLTAVPVAVRDLWSYVECVFDNPKIVGGDRVDDGQWDLKRVNDVLGASLALAEEADVVIVYWAGHGFVEGEHRLALSEGQPILTRTLADWLFALPVAAVVCILDCCGAGPGADAIRDLADKLKKAEAQEAKENRRIALIAAGRDENTEEGLLVRAMLEVLRRGPDQKLAEQDRWAVSDELVRADQLVAAVNERMVDQQAVVVQLRNRSLGRFFPSVWHQRSQRAGTRTIPPHSRARIKTESMLVGAGIKLPAGWTDADLHQTLRRLPADLSEERRRMIKARIDSLRLALSAHTMIKNVVNTDEIRIENLRSARHAAGGGDRDPQGTSLFDLLVEASKEMVGDRPGRPAERVLRFAARLDYELNDRGLSRRDRLFAWARAHGLPESADINANIDRACTMSKAAVLIISLLNPPETPLDIFPRRAEASLFIGATLCADSTFNVRIDPPDEVGVAAALAKLVMQFRGQMTTIHLLMPDQLLLFDPAEVPIPLNRHKQGVVGMQYAVHVHCDRAEDLRLKDFNEYYRQIIGQKFPDTHYDHCSGADEFDKFWNSPPALVFRFPVAAESRNTLLDAIFISPIVVWPATEPMDRNEFVQVLAEAWPDLPPAAEYARWRHGSDRGGHLSRLRMSWDDADWSQLQKDYYARR